MTRTAFIMAAAALLVPGAARAQGTDADRAAVIATVERLFTGMRTADSALVRSVFAPGARFASVDSRATPAVVRFEPVDGWIAAIATSARRWDERVYDVQVQVDGHMAQAWAPYTFYLDGAVRHCGINAVSLLRDAQGWKVTEIADTRRRENCPDPLKR